MSRSFPGGTVIKNQLASAGDARETGSIPGSGRSSREGSGNPLQCSCLENSIDNPWGHKELDTTEHKCTTCQILFFPLE